MNLPLSNMLDNSIITHSRTIEGHLIITLHFSIDNAHIADIIYCPQYEHMEIHLLEKAFAKFVLDSLDLTFSWLKVYAIALSNMQLMGLSENFMGSA